MPASEARISIWQSVSSAIRSVSTCLFWGSGFGQLTSGQGTTYTMLTLLK